MLHLNKKQFFWMIVIFASVILIQVVSILNKVIITDDEGVSYIAATGHQEMYENQSPKGKWVDVADWKTLWKPDKTLCFGTIGKDLAAYDIHPPLYFWFLHIWVLIFNTTLLSGSFLNLLFFAGIFFCLIIAGLKIHNSFGLSLGTSFVWSVSPAVMEYMGESRPYALLALFTIVFLILILDLLQSNGNLKITGSIAIALIAAAGTLTHYYFALIIAGASLAVLAKCYYSGAWKLFLRYITALFVSVLLFLMIHPYFYLSFVRQHDQAKRFIASELMHRIIDSAKSFNSYYFQGIFAKPGFIVTVFLIMLLLVVYFIKPDFRARLKSGITYTQKVVLFMFVFLSASIVGLYLAFISPPHAMTAKYLSMIHILIVLSTFIVLVQFNAKIQSALLILLCSWQLFMGILFINKEHNKFNAFRDSPERMRSYAKNLLVDMDERTVLPSILWYFPDDTRVYVANQDSLLNKPEKWNNQLGDSFVYVSDLRFTNTPQKRLKLISKIEETGYHLQLTEKFIYNDASSSYCFMK
jgi:hypothetical protein